jgi:hypothetical protein
MELHMAEPKKPPAPPPLPIEVEPASFLAAQERLAPERRP